ncbi:MAG: UvrD-helicase domain-containing protein, partial [Planctomycetota bacterium]
GKMAVETRIPDSQDRLLAVTGFDQDLFVEAGAGSGKTSLLVERMLQALLVLGVELREMAAITFTRKAAAEMQTRLGQELEEVERLDRNRHEPDPSTAAGRLWERLARDAPARKRAGERAREHRFRLDEAMITTLHSFCGAMLRRHPLACGLAPGFREDEGDALDHLIEEEGPRAISETLAALPPGTRTLLASFSGKELLQGLKPAVRSLPPPEPGPAAAPLDALALCLHRAAEKLRARYHDLGHVSFDELVFFAAGLLERPALRRAERARWKHLLVDELQDTDPFQFLLLRRLSFDPAEAGPRPRLFLVGDPKQSIYRFRRADLSAYGDFQESVERQGRRLVLNTNFRSRSRLLEPVNALFGKVMKTHPGIQPAYQAVEPAPGHLDPPGGMERIELLTVETQGRAPEIRQAEARVVAGRLLEERERGTRWGEILILLPQLTGLPILQEELVSAGIPFTVDGGKSFYKRQEVADFAALLCAWLGPEENENFAPALLAVLRSPAGGVPGGEILRYREEIGKAPFGTPPPDPKVCPGVAALLERLARWRRELAETAQGEVPACLLDLSGLRLAWALRPNGLQAAANLEKAAETVRVEVEQEGLSLGDAVQHLGDQLGQGEDSDQGVSEEKADAVTILTIHKAKGLEAEVVLLAGMEGAVVREAKGFQVLVDARQGYGIQIGKEEANKLFRDLAKRDRAHLHAEKLRLLYVALTRARRRLILVQSAHAHKRSVKDNLWLPALEEGWGYEPGKKPPQVPGVVFRTVRPSPARWAALPADEESLEKAAAAVEARRRLGLAAAPLFATPSRLHAEAPPPRGPPPGGAGGGPRAGRQGREDPRSGAAFGTLVHRLLEEWDFRSFESLQAALEPRAREASETGGVPLEDLLRRARDLLRRLPQTPCGERLRGLAGCRVFRELPLLHREDGVTWSGVLDLLVRDPEQAGGGGWLVADYKTDHGLKPEEALKLYGEQLRLYGRAVQAALKLPALPRLEIWLLDRGEIAEVVPRETPVRATP